VGTNAPTSKLHVVNNPGTFNTGITTISYVSGSAAGDPGGATEIRAFGAEPTLTGTNNVATEIAISAHPFCNMTAGTLATQIGLNMTTRLNGAATITDSAGVRAQAVVAGGGIVVNYRGLYIRSPSLAGGATITTAYGLVVEGLKTAGVTTAYGLYQSGGNDINYFAGDTGIGITGGTPPAARLHVKSAAANVALSVETTSAAGNGNPIVEYKDVGGRKGYIGYGAANDTLQIMNVRALGLGLGTNGVTRLTLAGDGTSLVPVDNVTNLGNSANRWKEVFAGIGAINTSDAREKTPLTPLSPAELAAAKAIAQTIGMYRWLDPSAYDDKVHAGVTAQNVIDCMADFELDALAYGFVRYDEWDASEAEARTAGSRYGVNYGELAMFIAAAQEQRLLALEAATAPVVEARKARRKKGEL
jgi:hypothetical protein